MTQTPHPLVAVVGASGILAPLGALLHGRGFTTVGISRGSRVEVGAWDVRLALDTQDPDQVAGWRAETAPDVVVAYAPAVADEVWSVLAEGVPRTVVVATSAWSAPDAPTPPWAGMPGVVLVRLGWVRNADGSRWHTPEEISAVVLDAVVGQQPEWVVGTVRPWEDRP